MKKLVWVFVLMLIPLASQAEWRHHFKHDYDRSQKHSSFWEDISHRQDRQAARIERGAGEGQLTRRELKKLYREQKHVRKQIKHLKRHHYLSHEDKRNMTEHMNFLSGKIRDLKHNDRYVSRKRTSNHEVYSDYGKRNYRLLARTNNDYSAGIYFRF